MKYARPHTVYPIPEKQIPRSHRKPRECFPIAVYVVHRKLITPQRRQIDGILRELCRQRGVELVEGHCKADHIHMCLSIPPKYSVAHTLGFLKGKSAVRVHRDLLQERRMTGLHFWATGYCVSTVGLDEAQIRKYIREQEKLESGQGDLDLK